MSGFAPIPEDQKLNSGGGLPSATPEPVEAKPKPKAQDDNATEPTASK